MAATTESGVYSQAGITNPTIIPRTNPIEINRVIPGFFFVLFLSLIVIPPKLTYWLICYRKDYGKSNLDMLFDKMHVGNAIAEGDMV